MGATCNVSNISKFYGERRVVDNVSIDIKDGEFLVILGPSGCGKTTTLRMIAGLETPDLGTISIGDRVASDPANKVFVRPDQRDIGMVFQSYAIWPHMTVFENVAFPLRARGAPKSSLKDSVEAVLEVVGLKGFSGRSASALSGGQMQRVVLARALVYKPKMLLFDEPLSNLDLKMREHLRVELKAVQERTGLTCIYVTHDQVEAVELADRIAVMEGGKLVQLGPPADLYRHPKSRFIAEFISSANIFSVEVLERLSTDLVRVSSGPGRDLVAISDVPVQPGERVDVVIHPEECTIELTTETSGCTATVLRARFQGISVRYTVDWKGQDFDVVVLGTLGGLEAGTRVRINIPPESARILPPVRG
jgi:iron(III) transport system ATP-binding protein